MPVGYLPAGTPRPRQSDDRPLVTAGNVLAPPKRWHGAVRDGFPGC